MAKRVVVALARVDEVLKEHEKDWRLVAVLALSERVAAASYGAETPSIAVRELYFEREER